MIVTGRVWLDKPETYKDKNDKEHVSLVLIDDDGVHQGAQFFRVEVDKPDLYKKGMLLRVDCTISFANQGNIRLRPVSIEILNEKK